MESKNKIAVLVPAYNEETTIGSVVRSAFGFSDFVIVIDDGSNDSTASVAANHQAQVLRNDENRGLGFSLRRGFSSLLSSGIELAITLDGDGVHDPAYIPALVQSHLDSNADITIGSRFMAEHIDHDLPSQKIAANYFATAIFNHICGSQLTDIASGFRVLNQSAMMLELVSNDYSVSGELLLAAIKANLKINESPISVDYEAHVLWCTKSSELLDLLDFLITKAEPSIESVIFLEQVRNRVKSYSQVALRMGSRILILHPIKEYQSFAFQLQPKKFSSLSDTTIILEELTQ